MSTSAEQGKSTFTSDSLAWRKNELTKAYQNFRKEEALRPEKDSALGDMLERIKAGIVYEDAENVSLSASAPHRAAKPYHAV